jgi:hypothetical protein
MGGGGGGQTQTSRTEISPEFKPYITYALGEAQRLYQGMPTAPETLAVAPSEATQQALQMAQQRAIAGSPLVGQAQDVIARQMGYTSPYAGRIEAMGLGAADPSSAFYRSMMDGQPESEAARLTKETASGSYLQGGSPFLQGALSQANRLAGEEFTRNIQALQSQAASAGRYGSSALGQQAGQAQDIFARSLAEQNQKAYLQNYMAERQAQEAAMGRLGSLEQQAIANRFAGASGLTAGEQAALQTRLGALGVAQNITAADLARQGQIAQLAPQMAAQDYADLQRLLQVGQAREGYEQQAIQGRLAAQDLPLQRLARAAQVTYGAPLETTSMSTSTPSGGK